MIKMVFMLLALLIIAIFCFLTIVSCTIIICTTYEETHKPLTLFDALGIKKAEDEDIEN